MVAVILTIHVLIVLALIGVVLMQRSDGGALGIGGGGGGGGFMSGRGAANALTRTTSILAAGFFATSLGLAIIAGSGEEDDNIIDELTREDAAAGEVAPADQGGAPSTEQLLESLGGESDVIEEAPVPAVEGPTVDDVVESAADSVDEAVDEASDSDATDDDGE